MGSLRVVTRMSFCEVLVYYPMRPFGLYCSSAEARGYVNMQSCDDVNQLAILPTCDALPVLLWHIGGLYTPLSYPREEDKHLEDSQHLELYITEQPVPKPLQQHKHSQRLLSTTIIFCNQTISPSISHSHHLQEHAFHRRHRRHPLGRP